MNRHRRTRFLQQILLWIFFLGLLVVFGDRGRALAQEGNGINLSAQAGLDGYCKIDTWMPVRVTVSNSGPDLNARVQISYKTMGGNTSITGTDISLPSTSQKQFFFYLSPQASFRDLKASLRDGNKSLAEVDLRSTCLSDYDLLVGLLAEDPSVYDVLNEVKTLNGSMRLAHLQSIDLPDQPQGWEGLDALVLAGQDVGTFTPAQQRALRAWLTNGGKLLVIGGLNWQHTTSGLEDLLPVSIDSTRNVRSLSALQGYSEEQISNDIPGILAVGRTHANARVLLEQDSYPLLVQRQIGLGIVYFLAADPGLRPLAGWDGMKEIYAHLFAFKVPRPIWSNRRWDPYAANQALATIPELGIPSIYYICGWLAVYIVILGPVNYLVLRRMKRGELAWFTIPIFVILFTCMAYFFGFFYRGTIPILNRIMVAQAWEGSEQARVQGVVGLYSPRRAKYGLEANDQFMFYSFDNNSLQKSGDWLTVQQGKTMLLPDVQVEIGGMQSVAVEGNIPALTFDHDLVLTLDSKTPVLRGTITNTSSIPLKNAVLITPGALTKLGDLPPSSSREVNLTWTVRKEGPVGISEQDPWNVLGLNSYSRNVEQEALRQSALLRAILYSNYEEFKTIGGTYLMGWVDEPLLPVTLQGSRFEAIDTTFYIMMLSPSVHIENGPVKLPPNMFIWEASAQNLTPYHAESSYFPAGGYELRFRPAVPIRFREVKSLILRMESSANPNAVQVDLWDFDQEGWVRLEDQTWGERRIPEPWRYVGLHGEIRIKIDGDRNNWMEIGPSYFTLVVEP